MVEDGGNVVINKREQLCMFFKLCVYITCDRMYSRSLNNVTFHQNDFFAHIRGNTIYTIRTQDVAEED